MSYRHKVSIDLARTVTVTVMSTSEEAAYAKALQKAEIKDDETITGYQVRAIYEPLVQTICDISNKNHNVLALIKDFIKKEKVDYQGNTLNLDNYKGYYIIDDFIICPEDEVIQIYYSVFENGSEQPTVSDFDRFSLRNFNLFLNNHGEDYEIQ